MSGQIKLNQVLTTLLEDMRSLGLLVDEKTPLQQFTEQVHEDESDEDDNQEKEVSTQEFPDGVLADEDDDREEKEESRQGGSAEEVADTRTNRACPRSVGSD